MQRWTGGRRLISMSFVAPTADSERRPGSELTELFREHHLELVRLALIMVGDLSHPG